MYYHSKQLKSHDKIRQISIFNLWKIFEVRQLLFWIRIWTAHIPNHNETLSTEWNWVKRGHGSSSHQVNHFRRVWSGHCVIWNLCWCKLGTRSLELLTERETLLLSNRPGRVTESKTSWSGKKFRPSSISASLQLQLTAYEQYWLVIPNAEPV